jgi:hypothetical protein
MRVKRLIVALLALTAACTPAPAPAPHPAPSPFAADTAVVFAADKAVELTEQCSRAVPAPVAGTWTPSDAQIAALEPALGALLGEQLHAQWPNDRISASDYRRQYGGLIVGGRRIIYVNGFRPDDDNELDTWRTWPMAICDGGPVQFGVEYDVASGEFANFAFNGAV